MLWLWPWPAGIGLIRPLAWELPYATSVALQGKKKSLWDATKAVLKGKLIAIQAFHKKEEKSQTDNVTHHLNELEKEQRIEKE